FDYRGIWMIDLHEKLHYSDALETAQRHRLVGPRRSWSQRNFIMLSAPHSALAPDNYLRLEHTLDSSFDRSGCALAPRLVNKTIVDSSFSYIAQHLHHSNHGAVVESDVLVVAFPDGKVLRPSAVVVLGR